MQLSDFGENTNKKLLAVAAGGWICYTDRKEKESEAMRIINFGSLNIDKVYRGGAVCPAGTDHHREGLRRSCGRLWRYPPSLSRVQERINHRKRGKLNLRKECIGMHITIERDGCISCGLCEGTCPSVFRIAEDGLAEVHHQPETAEEQAGAQEAAGGCPVAVIHVS